ncbi:MAG: hypothetical protein NWE79_04685 [Candidatus Bathyarchaeota archaeon]|nr:hypothetical protein [Candidatus Bathyarchaeota archaeon]
MVDSLFWDEVTPEEEDALIKKAAEAILKYEMDAAAILVLQSFKPLVSFGGQVGRFFLGPLLPFMGEREDALIQTFEKRENVEKLIRILEEARRQEDEKRRAERKSEGNDRSGWKRFLPF